MDIVMFSSSDFDFIRTRKQHIARALAYMGHKILYIEPPRAGKWNGIPLSRHDLLSKKTENLYVYSPAVFPYMGKSNLVNRLNYQFILFKVNRIIKKLEFRDHTLWIYPPRAFWFKGKTGEKRTVFDCIQYWPFSSEPDWVKHELPGYISSSDIVFTPDQQIRKYCKKENAKSFLVPHASSPQYFIRKSSPPKDVARIQKPVIGICASISSYWIDLELIRDLALENRDLSFAVIGPMISGEKADIWQEIPNIHYLGEKPFSALPAYLQHINLGLIPFRRIEAVKGILPLKFFDYLACGLPIVTTTPIEISEFIPYASHGDRHEISALIRASLRSDSPKLQKKRINMAKKYTWVHRITDMLSHIQNHS